MIPDTPLNLFLLKELTTCGMEIPTFMSYLSNDVARNIQERSELFAGGRLQTYTDAWFPLT